MPSNIKVIYAINKYSIEIYDGIVTGKIKIQDIYELIINKGNVEDLNMKEVSLKKAKEIFNSYNKMTYLEDILYINSDKYSHLRGIKDLVNLNNLINYAISDDILIEKIKIDYSNKIIDKLLETYYDYDNAKLLSKLKEALNISDQKLNIKIVKKINEYYVKKITV